MRFASYFTGNRSSFGLVEGDRIYDLGSRFGEGCPDLKTAIQQARLKDIKSLIAGADADFHVNDIEFLPTIPNPNRIMCVGLNYHDHRKEANRAETANPTIFMRLAESQTGHKRALLCPRESDQFDFEGEVAVIIGRGGRRIDESRALEHIAGMSCYNDGSVRDWQAHTTQWDAGKNFPSTGAFGPWMVDTEELPGDSSLELTTRINGEIVQSSNTDLLVFSIPRLISYISTFTTLEAGDVIVTGTPGGVGFKRQPPLFMNDQDVVEVEVSGIGTLVNSVKKEV